jgi:hypothetical protein
MGAFGTIAIKVFSFVIVILVGGAEPFFCLLNIVGDLWQVGELQWASVLFDQAVKVYPVEEKMVVFEGVFFLREIIGLIDKINVFGFHQWILKWLKLKSLLNIIKQ